MRITFSNISDGVEYLGTKLQEYKWGKYIPQKYYELYSKIKPDILGLAEVPLDNTNGKSHFIEGLSKNCGYIENHVCGHEKSFIVTDFFSGEALLSKLKFEYYQTFKFENLRFKIQRPNGEKWELFDKFYQIALLSMHNNTYCIVNTHTFPLHIFNHKPDEPNMVKLWDPLLENLKTLNFEKLIIMGDFNNRKIPLLEIIGKIIKEYNMVELFSNYSDKHSLRYFARLKHLSK